MKKSVKYLLSGVLASSMMLTAFATSNELKKMDETLSNSSAIFKENTQILKETASQAEATSTLSVDSKTDLPFQNPVQVQVLSSAAAYDAFYSVYGYDKSATVFYNGTEIPCTDAFPLIENGTTFVPLAVLAETIGAAVEYDTETHSVSLVYQGNSISFHIGDATFTVNGGQEQSLPAATFTANDRSYVPLRFITDAFGLDIYWNDTYKQVITADLSSLKEGISDNYSLMNALLTFTNLETAEANSKVTGDFVYELNAEGKTALINGGVSALANGDMTAMSYNMDFEVDLSQFDQEIKDLLAEMSAYPEEEAVVNQLLDAIASFQLNYVYDLGNLDFYLQSDLVTGILPLLSVNGTSLSVEENTWFKLPLSDFMLDQEMETMQTLSSQFSGKTSLHTMEELVDEMMGMTRSIDNHETNIYAALVMMLEQSSDDKFNQDGDVHTLTSSYTHAGQLASFSLALTVSEDSAVDSYEARILFQDEMNMTASFSQQSPETVDFAFEGNMSGVDFTCQGALKAEGTQEYASAVPTNGSIFDLSTFF